MGIKRITTTSTVMKPIEQKHIEYEISCDGCNMELDEDDIFTPIKVEAGERNEEGWIIIERIYCEECLGPMQDALTKLGFKSHFHGSTNLLEDRECPGSGMRIDIPRICPTPEKGMYHEDDID